MAPVYVDPTLGTGSNDGTSPANAFKTWAAFATAGCAAGSDVRVANDEASTSAVTLTSNINGSVAAGFTTITGYDATFTTPTTRFRDGNGAGANIDGFILTGVQFVHFKNIGAKRYTRDGMRSVTTASKWCRMSYCVFNNNAGVGVNLLSATQIGMELTNCKIYSNTGNGVSTGFGTGIKWCDIYSNAIGLNVASGGSGTLILENIIRNNTTGIATAGTICPTINNVIDANTTGLTISEANNKVIGQIVGNRFTNNVTVAIAWGTAIVIEIGNYNHFYNNGALHTGANGLYVANTDVADANDPYVARASQNFKNINTATLYKNMVNVGIDATNQTNVQAGLIREMDYPALTAVFNDTADGDAGTLPAGKVLKSNTDPGTFNDDNLSVGNVRPVAFGVGLTGDLSNLAATDAAYLAVQATNNTDMAAAKVENGYAYITRGVNRTGTLATGGPGAPAKPTITARVWGTGKIRIDCAPSANAASYIYKRGVTTIATLTAAGFFLDTGLAAGLYSYTVTAHNGDGDTVSDPAVITAELTQSEAAMWTAIKACITANTALDAAVDIYEYYRVTGATLTAGQVRIKAYPYLSKPSTKTTLTFAFIGQVQGSTSTTEDTLAALVVLMKDTIATIPGLESWLGTPVISTDEDVAFDQPKSSEQVIQAYMEVRVAIA